jgi:hypothetical protein
MPIFDKRSIQSIVSGIKIAQASLTSIVNEGSHDNQTSIHMIPSEVENLSSLRTYPSISTVAINVSRQLYHYYQTIQVFLFI